MAARPIVQSKTQAGPVIKTPLGSFSELPLQTFFDKILPPLHHDLHPDQIFQRMKNIKKSPKVITRQKRWRGFARDPKYSEHSVYDTFKHLDSVVKSIQDASSSLSDCARSTIRFQSSPGSATRHNHSLEESFPDASFFEGPERDWSHIAVCGEYQTGDVAHGVQDSITKVTASMISCMRNDVRRRFVLGFTIENTDMRIWLCDRSRILVSQPFNFITPHELGWDTTMKPLQDGDNFDISIQSSDGQTRTYRTQSMLSSRGPRDRMGRGTKVWCAVRLENGEEIGPPVALKDCWVNPGYTREGDIIRRIRQDALTPEDEEIVKRVFLDAQWHGDVSIGEDEPILDRTVTLGDDELSEQPTRGLVHYRLVLTPAGQKNIEHEKSVPIIYNALAHAAGALQLMHKAGWVHRDVSTGNILLGDQPRLVDFEYAKQASDDDDFALGTRLFKALEVDASREELVSHTEQPEADSPKDEPEAQKQQTDASKVLQPTQEEASSSSLSERHPLRFNPLHDLESLWWIAVYFLLKREVQSGGSDNAEDSASWNREEQRKWADNVFYSNDYRNPIMMSGSSGFFESHITPVVHPTMRPVVRILEDVRQQLAQRYAELEKDPTSIDFSCAEGIHELFMAAFFEIEEHPPLKDVKLVPLAVPSDIGLSLYENTAVSEAPQPPTDPAKTVGEEQKGKKETRKGPKSRPRRKSVTVTQTHRYNLRPRIKRS
ncbi:hypothetical protein EIP86_010386 [Pleurotus ostreatoroseus]|nr:hypothetical protein EIP86_010386 [Pleurotus ostreatoroseus]